MKKISEVQNEQINLDRLAAQRVMYDEVRKRKTYRVYLVVIGAILWTVIGSLFLKNNLLIVMGSILLLTIELIMNGRLERPLQEAAAKIQELFDCEVLGLTWKRNELGIPPSPEIIGKYASRYDPAKYPNSKLPDWYCRHVDKLPLYLARVVCQRSNLSWDKQIRLRFVWLLVKLMILMLIVLTIAWCLIFTKYSYFTFIASACLPAISFVIQEIKENITTISDLHKMNDRIDTLWYEAFIGKANVQEIEKASEGWQLLLYNHRKNSPVIFSKIYDKYRDIDEGDMNKVCETLVDDALIKLNKDKNEL